MNDRIAAAIDRELPPEEARAYRDHPIGAGEREQVLALVRWFRGRYPAPAARLSYARRAYASWPRTTRQRPGS